LHCFLSATSAFLLVPEALFERFQQRPTQLDFRRKMEASGFVSHCFPFSYIPPLTPLLGVEGFHFNFENACEGERHFERFLCTTEAVLT
jgi:hypothetical protein